MGQQIPVSGQRRLGQQPSRNQQPPLQQLPNPGAAVANASVSAPRIVDGGGALGYPPLNFDDSSLQCGQAVDLYYTGFGAGPGLLITFVNAFIMTDVNVPQKGDCAGNQNVSHVPTPPNAVYFDPDGKSSILNAAAGFKNGFSLYYAQDSKPHTIKIRSEERRVGKECRSRWSPEHRKKPV